MYEPVPAEDQHRGAVEAPRWAVLPLPPGAPLPPPVLVTGEFATPPSAQFAPERFAPQQFPLYGQPAGPGRYATLGGAAAPVAAPRAPWSMRRSLLAVAMAVAIAGATAVGVAAADTGTSAQTTPGGFGNPGGTGFRGGFGNQGGFGGQVGGSQVGGQVVPGAGQVPGAAAQPTAVPTVSH